jgi:hypothetical protein
MVYLKVLTRYDGDQLSVVSLTTIHEKNTSDAWPLAAERACELNGKRSADTRATPRYFRRLASKAIGGASCGRGSGRGAAGASWPCEVVPCGKVSATIRTRISRDTSGLHAATLEVA